MAHQDYVSRPPSGKKSPYKKGSVELPKGLPLKVKLIGLLTLCIISGFAYLLWSIKDNESAPIESPTAAIEKKQEIKTSLPTPPKEKWAYRKELADKEIEVGQYKVKQGGPYKMQCGSFRTLKQANVLKANIAFAGLTAQVGKSVGKKSTYYKVFLGPYVKKRDAEKDKHKLKRNKINYCQIWLWK